MAKHYRRADGSFAGTWVDGAPTDDTLVETPTAPADGAHLWDNASQTWKPKLAAARKNKIAQVKDRYRAELNEGMTYLTKLLEIDSGAQNDIIAATDTARDPDTVWNPAFSWRMGDDSFITLPTTADMILLCRAMKAEVYRLKLNKWLHTDNIKVLATVEEIEAYDITTGW